MMKSVIVLDDIHDKTLVFSIMCNKAFTFYSYLKYSFHLPVVFISAVLSVINGNLKDFDEDAINLLNVISNALSALLLVVSNQLAFESRASHFKNQGIAFIKLSREVEMYLLPIKDVNEIDDTYVKTLMLDYDKLVSSMAYDVPRSICNNVRRTYIGKRTLPNIIAEGSRKLAIHRQNSICSILENCPAKPLYDNEVEVEVVSMDKKNDIKKYESRY